MLWIAYGVWTSRSQKALPVPRLAGHTLGAALFLILGAVVLAGGLTLISRSHGLQNGSLQAWAVVAVFATGLVFVQLQIWGAIGLVTAALRRETHPRGQASLAKEDPE